MKLNNLSLHSTTDSDRIRSKQKFRQWKNIFANFSARLAVKKVIKTLKFLDKTKHTKIHCSLHNYKNY